MLANEANKKIFEWAMGGKVDPFNFRLMPDFTDPSPAFGLLDILVKRGYQPQLCYLYNDYAGKYLWFLDLYQENGFLYLKDPKGCTTKSAAICEVICGLIDLEAANERK